MKIKQDHRCHRREFLDLLLDAPKRIIQFAPHEGVSLRVDHSHRGLTCAFDHCAPLAWGASGIIDRPHKSRFLLQQDLNLFLIPEMIPAGDHIYARRINLRCCVRRDTVAAGGIFAVGHHYIKPMLRPQAGQQLR